MEKENVILKSANVLSNAVVGKVSDAFLFEDVTFAENEKDAKKRLLTLLSLSKIVKTWQTL